MYPQVQGSDNKTMYIVIAVLAILALVGSLLYVFVFKCEDDGSECATTSDCCEGLECIDSKCSSSTPTVSPQPVVVNNVEPEPGTCADWDVGNDCETGTILTSGTVIGNSQSECCRPLTCADWDVGNDCVPGTTLTPETETVIGSSDDDCCRPLTCQEWYDDTNVCDTGTTPTSGTVIGYSDIECCVPDVDCEGTFSPCTAACETASGRTFTEIIAQSGSGAACPVATDCVSGQDDCPPPTWHYGGFNEDCDDVCGNVGLVCHRGQWGIYNQERMEEALSEAGQVGLGVRCSVYSASGNNWAPFIDTEMRHATEAILWDADLGEWQGTRCQPSAGSGGNHFFTDCATRNFPGHQPTTAGLHRRLCKCWPK